jgi:hypothetical protein
LTLWRVYLLKSGLKKNVILPGSPAIFLRRGDYNVNMVSKCEYSPSQMGIYIDLRRSHDQFLPEFITSGRDETAIDASDTLCE